MNIIPRTARRILLVVLLLALGVMPLIPDLIPEQTWVTNSRLFSFTQMFMLITLASDWNLTGGFAGYVDFGHAVFFGIGAYGTGILMNYGWDFWPAMVLGAVFAVIFALIDRVPDAAFEGPLLRHRHARHLHRRP